MRETSQLVACRLLLEACGLSQQYTVTRDNLSQASGLLLDACCLTLVACCLSQQYIVTRDNLSQPQLSPGL